MFGGVWLKVLLTGPPRVGKTTVVKRLVGLIRDQVALGGFLTEEIREHGQRVGFKIVTLDGEEAILAHRSFRSKYRVGPYGVNIEDLDRVGVESLRRAMKNSRVVILDEIGKMECFSKVFVSTVFGLLASNLDMVATFPKRYNPLDNPEPLKKAEILVVTRENRDELPRQLASRILAKHGKPC